MKLTLGIIKKLIKEEMESVIDEEHYKSRTDVDNYIDADELIGQRLWSHTNRTHRKNNKNGMIGLYGVTSEGKKTGSPLYYTNCIRFKAPIVFETTEKGAERIAQTGHRTLVAGVSGTVIETKENHDLEGFVPFGFNPFGDNKFFHVNGKKLVGAKEVYFHASEDGKYTSLVKGPEFEGEQIPLPYDPEDIEKFDKPSIAKKRKYNRRKKTKDSFAQIPLDFGD